MLRGEQMNSLGRFFSGLFAGLALFAWVALCAAVFWFLFSRLSQSSPQAAMAAVEGMMWPFTVITIAVPVLLIVAFGGLRAVGRLVELQKMVSTFPKDVEAMQDAVEVFRTMKEDLTRLSGQIITDINRANVETGQDEARQHEESAAIQAQGKDAEYVTNFYRMYEKAKRYFYEALRKYNQSAPEPRIIARGESYAPIAQMLKEKRAGLFDPGPRRDIWIADWVIAMFETERNTRANRAALLTEEDVRKLAQQEQDSGS